MNDLHWLTAAEIGAAYAARTLVAGRTGAGAARPHRRARPSASTLSSSSIAKAVLAAAREAEREIRAGRTRGPLHGVPVGIKDIIDVAGQATTCHSKILRREHGARGRRGDRPPARGRRDPVRQTVAARIRDRRPVVRPAVSARAQSVERRSSPGGSSSGSGAALAAGFLPLALGTDTGGSIRNPAGTCGVVGLKPTYGLVSRRGVFPLSFTLDHIGPMARSVATSHSRSTRWRATAAIRAARRRHGSAPISSAARAACASASCATSTRPTWRPIRKSTAALDEAAQCAHAEGAEVRDIKLPPLQELRVCSASSCWPNRGRCTPSGCASGPATTPRPRAAS